MLGWEVRRSTAPELIKVSETRSYAVSEIAKGGRVQQAASSKPQPRTGSLY